MRSRPVEAGALRVVLAEHRDGTPVAVAVPLEDLDGRRLARPVLGIRFLPNRRKPRLWGLP